MARLRAAEFRGFTWNNGGIDVSIEAIQLLSRFRMSEITGRNTAQRAGYNEKRYGAWQSGIAIPAKHELPQQHGDKGSTETCKGPVPVRPTPEESEKESDSH